MGIPRPIVEFLGAIVGVDPDHYPKGDEDAMRAYAARYDALAADLRAKAGAEAQQAASAIATAWNGEGGRALSQQLNLYVTQQEFGGVEAIAKNAEALAQYLRDQADTIARTKVMIWAQVAIGIAMFILPAGRLISAIQQTAWRTLLRNFITSRAKKALAEGTAQAAASKAKLGIGARIKAVAPGFSRGAFVGAGGAALFGLGPNTVAQIYGLRTGQDGRQVMDDQGNYHHEEGWNWEETRNYAKITAWAIPIAGVTGGLVAGVGRVAVRNVNALDTQAWSWAGRRVVGAAAMTTSLPAAEKIVNGHDPTWDSLWRAAVMGAAMPSHPFRAPDSAPPGGHPDTAPVKTPEVREHTTIDGSTRRAVAGPTEPTRGGRQTRCACSGLDRRSGRGRGDYENGPAGRRGVSTGRGSAGGCSQHDTAVSSPYCGRSGGSTQYGQNTHGRRHRPDCVEACRHRGARCAQATGPSRRTGHQANPDRQAGGRRERRKPPRSRGSEEHATGRREAAWTSG